MKIFIPMTEGIHGDEKITEVEMSGKMTSNIKDASLDLV